jgi:hypothetical protein
MALEHLATRSTAQVQDIGAMLRQHRRHVEITIGQIWDNAELSELIITELSL